MIPLIPTHETAAAPFAGWNVAGLFQDIVRSWIAHHQRLADSGIGLGGDL
ncbi:hypothetical protein [Methylobacterium sp. J-076]|nr:hypothetical protein [Methylobacterium sp. J-076]MCJ2013302.1 hypothetical protein [Methylobacterium sp. J-076]